MARRPLHGAKLVANRLGVHRSVLETGSRLAVMGLAAYGEKHYRDLMRSMVGFDRGVDCGLTCPIFSINAEEVSSRIFAMEKSIYRSSGAKNLLRNWVQPESAMKN